MLRNSLFFALALTVASPLWAEVKAGDRAPEFQFVRLIPGQPTADLTLGSFAGKPVILEFWATWCGPCVGAIPHLNELAVQFKDRIVFLSLTDEPWAVVEEFLTKRPIEGLVGVRPKSVAREYGVTGIPTTFLIDAAGKVAGVTGPSFLTPAVLEDFLAGRPLNFPKLTPALDMSVKLSGDESGPPPLFEAVLRPSTAPEGTAGFRTGKGNLTFRGFTQKVLLVHAFGFPRIRVAGDGASEQDKYDLSISLRGADEETLRTLLQGFLPAAFQVRVSRENRDTDVLVLKAPKGRPETLKEGAGTGSGTGSSRSSFRLTNGSMKQLVTQFEMAAGRPVVDETGITGKFDFELKWDYDAADGVIEAMKKAGFTVETAHRPVEFLIVKK